MNSRDLCVPKLTFPAFLLASIILTCLSIVAPAAAQVSESESPGGESTESAKRSESPHLHLSEEMLEWPTVAPPRPDPAPAASEDPTAMVGFDLIQRVEERVPSAEQIRPGKDVLRHAPPSLGSLGDGWLAQEWADKSVLGADDRVRITDTESYPWRTVVKLFITAASGANYICSGALVGRDDGNAFHVLTAGHCIYIHDQGGWISSVRVVPGLDQTYMPYNEAYGTYLRSYTGWTSSQSHEHDWGLITLDRRVGNYTGWMGRITRSSSDSFYTGIFNAAGYPGDLGGGLEMYFDSDVGRTATENNHWYYIDTAGGQSGMPVWAYFTSGSDPPPGRYIATVHAYGNDGSGSNHGTRLNLDKFNRLTTWTEDDGLPTDRADLIDDGQPFSGFSPTTVSAGSGFSAYNDVRNIGTANSGSFTVSYYASVNTIISSSDYLIGSTTVSSVSPFTWADSNFSGTFPPGIPEGTYWVGWIIDSSNVVTEFDEGNNTAYNSGYQLTVSSSCSADAFEPDGSAGQASFHATNSSTVHSICPAGDEDWSYFVLDEVSEVTLQTTGLGDDDTRMWLYDSSLAQVAFDDDGGSGLFSRLDFTCGANELPAGLYYVQIDEYGDDEEIESYGLSLSASTCPDTSLIFTDGFESGDTSAWTSTLRGSGTGE